MTLQSALFTLPLSSSQFFLQGLAELPSSGGYPDPPGLGKDNDLSLFYCRLNVIADYHFYNIF